MKVDSKMKENENGVFLEVTYEKIARKPTFKDSSFFQNWIMLLCLWALVVCSIAYALISKIN